MGWRGRGHPRLPLAVAQGGGDDRGCWGGGRRRPGLVASVCRWARACVRARRQERSRTEKGWGAQEETKDRPRQPHPPGLPPHPPPVAAASRLCTPRMADWEGTVRRGHRRVVAPRHARLRRAAGEGVGAVERGPPAAIALHCRPLTPRHRRECVLRRGGWLPLTLEPSCAVPHVPPTRLLDARRRGRRVHGCLNGIRRWCRPAPRSGAVAAPRARDVAAPADRRRCCPLAPPPPVLGAATAKEIPADAEKPHHPTDVKPSDRPPLAIATRSLVVSSRRRQPPLTTEARSDLGRPRPSCGRRCAYPSLWQGWL